MSDLDLAPLRRISADDLCTLLTGAFPGSTVDASRTPRDRGWEFLVLRGQQLAVLRVSDAEIDEPGASERAIARVVWVERGAA